MRKQKQFKRVLISNNVVLKSGLEEVVYKFLKNNCCEFGYESLKVAYSVPDQKKIYKPDFPIFNSFIVETKGQFNSADRKKMKLVKQQNPTLDIRFVFSNAKTRIGKKSQTTYAKWCEMFGFPYHCIQSTKETFPKLWLEEIQLKQQKSKQEINLEQIKKLAKALK
jgi:hypothetical protein